MEQKAQKTLLMRLGDVLGCGLAKFAKNGKPDKGKTWLYRILTLETAYLIWKMCNKRRIRDGDKTDNKTSDSKIHTLGARG